MKTRTRASSEGQRVRKSSRASVRRRPKLVRGVREFCSRNDAETRRDWQQFRLTLRPGLERDTLLMPWLVAESVCGEVARFLDVEIPARYEEWLEAKAERCYARFDHFRKLMRGRGNVPRDWLRTYMRHWLAGLLGVERPDLYECLPESFALGHALPPPVHPRRRWRGNGRPLYAPCDWNPERVLQHRRWRWLVKWLASSPGARR